MHGAGSPDRIRHAAGMGALLRSHAPVAGAAYQLVKALAG
jgi:hypothetical protein